MHSRRLDSCVVAFLTVGVVLASCTTGERDGDLRTPYTVAGTITDADTGGPLPDITIVFLGEGAPGSVTTGADGRYEQTGFFPGTLIVAPAGNYDFLYRDPASGESLVAPVEIDIAEGTPNNTVQVDFTAVTSGTSLDLLDPNGGEQLPAGSVAQIEWTVTGDDDEVLHLHNTLFFGRSATE